MAVIVAVTEQALSDIEEIANYIGRDSSHYAGLQVAKIFSRVEALQQFPSLGRVVPEINVKYYYSGTMIEHR